MRGEVRSIGAKQLTKVQYANAESNPIHAFFWRGCVRVRSVCRAFVSHPFFPFLRLPFIKIFC